MAGTAQGAVDSLLGRLSSVLLDEAQLLRGVRRDVEFIRDEMESMNVFLLDVAAAKDLNHQVRGWAKQVKELAYDSQDCIDRYMQCVPGAGSGGVLATLGRPLHLLTTMTARHRTAVRIRELKARARELGERRRRYDVTVVPHVAVPVGGAPALPAEEEDFDEQEEEEDARRRALANSTEFLDEDVREVISWLAKELPRDHPQRRLRVIAFVRRQYQEDEYPLTRKVYEHPSLSSCFQLKAWINGVDKYMKRKETLHCILDHLPAATPALDDDHADDKPSASIVAGGGGGDDMREEAQLAKELKDRLEGKRFLIITANDPYGKVRTEIESAAAHLFVGGGDYSPSSGSAIIVTTWFLPREPWSSNLYKVKNYLHIDTLFHEKAVALVGGDRCDDDLQEIIRKILTKRGGNFFSMEMFLHALYVNPNRPREQLQSLLDRLVFGSIIATHMILFCYNDLPSRYKSCLLYLSILFERMMYSSSQDLRVKRTSIVRRWAAENLITNKDGLVATDEAENCFAALVARGLVRPVDIGADGKVKTCTVHYRVVSFISKMARDEGLVDTDLPPDLACRLSIRNGIRLQHLHLHKMKGAKQSTTGCCCRNNIREHPTPIIEGSEEDSKYSMDMDYTEVFLESLETSPPLGLVQVLDLEGFKGLKKRHLKHICDKVYQLKYLSIRNTDITELPNNIDKLRYLETLDIRQTKIQALTSKAVVLSKLMHLLAGNVEHQRNESATTRSWGRSISTVHVPPGIWSMIDLQILCHVQVSNSADELMVVGRLHQLRKLGVVLCGKEAHLSHLLRVIDSLNECLCSLSLQIDLTSSETPDLNMGHTTFSPPKLLKSLTIHGNITGLPSWIKELRQLSKITLCGTFLMDNAIRTLGELTALSCLRLWHKSYMDMRLTFKDEEFQNLKYLAVEGSHITTIHFENGSAPKLEKIAWAFTQLLSLSGVKNLPGLKEIELNGDCDPYQIIQEMAVHSNHPIVIHNAKL